jgi:hypothetical protein
LAAQNIAKTPTRRLASHGLTLKLHRLPLRAIVTTGALQA